MRQFHRDGIKLNRYLSKQYSTYIGARWICIVTLLLYIGVPVTPIHAVESATIVNLVAPDAPTQLTASAGDGSVDLYWVAPVNDGGSPITSYNIEVFDGISAGPATVAPLLGTATQTSARVIGLTNGVSYTFSVRAVNADGPGAWSTGVTKTPTNTAGTGLFGQAISEAAVTYGFLSPMETDYSLLLQEKEQVTLS